MFKTWEAAFQAQKEKASNYDNGFENTTETGVECIDKIPFALGEYVWLIMAEGFQLYDYEEWAVEYGIDRNGKWVALDDSHCSCYGWEATEGQITEYDSLEQLLQADPKAAVITKYAKELMQAYPFLTI